jgi:hypothetical protein
MDVSNRQNRAAYGINLSSKREREVFGATKLADSSSLIYSRNRKIRNIRSAGIGVIQINPNLMFKDYGENCEYNLCSC